ncbi:MAG: hypothetical protein NTW55_03175, partial [Planctomycetota bacterium]|nr:hypothetical protein [Planctomycetota bacterium]
MMKRIKSEKLLAMLIIAALTTCASAMSIPAGWTEHKESTASYGIFGGQAMVESDVYYGYGPVTGGPSYQDKYIYAYQVTNNSGLGLSFFSVGISPAGDAFDPDQDITGAVVPASSWAVVTSPGPVKSVNALFADTIDNDGKLSSILWFVSDYAPTSGNAALFGMAGGIPFYTATPTP